MAPRPKYRAVRNFSVAGERYVEGDEVPAGPALQIALTHGDSFVKADTARNRRQDADEPSTEPTED